MNSSGSFCHTFILIASLLICGSENTRACACCSDRGAHSVQPAAPLTGYMREQMNGMEFASAAQLFLVDGPDIEEQVKGLTSISDSYFISSAAEAKQWRLKFRTEGGESGELILPLPNKVARFVVDIHNGETNTAGQPLLYKEWRLEGRATGDGMFKEGFAAPARYTLIFQGRGNSCDNADDFTHWRLEIAGKKAAYAFFGELISAHPKHAKQRKLVHDATVAQGASSTEEGNK